MKYKTLRVLPIIVGVLCGRAVAQSSGGDTNAVTHIPVVGDETPLASLLASPRRYLGLPVIICGSVKVVNNYNFRYDNASATHFSLDFGELTKDVLETGEFLTVYAKRGMAGPLVNHILEAQKDGNFVVLRLKVVITARSFDGGDFGENAELVDWQLLTPHDGGWFPWAVATADAAAQDLENRRRQEQQVQSAAERDAADALRERNRLALRARALKFNQDLADQGDAGGQFRMGERYRDGDGVPKDAAKAKEYFNKSAAQGNRDAARALETLNADTLRVNP